MTVAKVFPTACEAIMERRDPALAERMVPALEEGGAFALVGVTHCPGVIAALRSCDFAVSRASDA